MNPETPSLALQESPKEPGPTLVGGLDEGFPARVLRTSVWLTVVVLVLAALQQAWRVVIGFGVGAGINLAAFLALDGTLGALLGAARESRRGMKWFWTAVAFLKFPALVAAMALSLTYMEMDYIAFAAGLGIAQAVMISKVASLVLVDAVNRWIPPPPPTAEIRTLNSRIPAAGDGPLRPLELHP